MGFFMKIFFIPARSSFADAQVRNSVPEMERTSEDLKKEILDNFFFYLLLQVLFFRI